MKATWASKDIPMPCWECLYLTQSYAFNKPFRLVHDVGSKQVLSFVSIAQMYSLFLRVEKWSKDAANCEIPFFM